MHLKTWKNGFWSRSSLRSIGLTIQLGHPPHEVCLTPGSKTQLVVVHSTGFHIVDAQFCGCDYSSEGHLRRHQLFRAGWFPASHNRPETAFTMTMLESFHEMTLQGKISAHDYYQSIVNLTDNAGLTQIPVSATIDMNM